MKAKTKPECPACGASFSHDLTKKCCKKCGVSDEELAKGPRAIRKLQIANGLLKPNASTANRRRRTHGRPRSRGRVRGGSSSTKGAA